MEILKKVVIAAALALPLSVAASAHAAPALGFSAAATPYGSFGCKQRAEAKLYSIGATGISKSSNSSSVWAYYNGTHSIGIWCRGSEVIVIVGGSGDTSDLRNEIITAF